MRRRTSRACFRNAIHFSGVVPARSSRSLAEKLTAIWPRLALISCWADAAAAQPLGDLRELFPHVEVQPKGLLATEGCATIPLLGHPAPVLAIRAHFFEFMPAGEPEHRAGCLLAYELDRGGRYHVVLTTGGGLYRYQLRDEVEVIGFEQGCPLLRFLGKADRISDLVGEKLAEPFVRAVLDALFREYRLAPRFALLAPIPGQPSRYRLFLQDHTLCDAPELLERLRRRLEAGLCENPYYRHAVALGQLAQVELAMLAPEGPAGWQLYQQCCVERGQRAGNIKPTALDLWTGWAAIFRADLCLATADPVRCKP